MSLRMSVDARNRDPDSPDVVVCSLFENSGLPFATCVYVLSNEGQERCGHGRDVVLVPASGKFSRVSRIKRSCTLRRVSAGVWSGTFCSDSNSRVVSLLTWKAASLGWKVEEDRSCIKGHCWKDEVTWFGEDSRVMFLLTLKRKRKKNVLATLATHEKKKIKCKRGKAMVSQEKQQKCPRTSTRNRFEHGMKILIVWGERQTSKGSRMEFFMYLFSSSVSSFSIICFLSFSSCFSSCRQQGC
jgi:hypothetical protein